MEISDFQADVIENSRGQPTVVDFWAPWCGPCRILGPVLEKLEKEAAGAWRLAKLNTDETPEVASRYGISGIPAVKMFVDGNVVAEFVGALPEARVKSWLEDNLPSASRELVSEGAAAYEQGDSPTAHRLAAQVLGSDPANLDAMMLLARAVVFTDPSRAIELAGRAAAGKPTLYESGQAVETIAGLVAATTVLPEGAGRETYATAVEALSAGRVDSAVPLFIEVIRKDKHYADDAARKALIAIFRVLGDNHPVTRANRRSFEMAVF